MMTSLLTSVNRHSDARQIRRRAGLDEAPQTVGVDMCLDKISEQVEPALWHVGERACSGQP